MDGKNVETGENIKAEPTFPLWCVDRLRMATDGTGVTALVCAFGCPLDCRYCINPESHSPDGTFTCVTVEELYKKVRQDGLYYSATGGGITFGGGEPLLNAGFIAEFRKRIPADWNVYAETSLAVPRENVLIASGAVAHFMVDVKDMNREIYGRYTGRPDLYPLMVSNLRLLVEKAGPGRITARLPLIKNFNTKDDVRASKEALRSIGIEDFDVFVYKTDFEKKKKERK
ncbi:MAG: radical SAM protein [Clostridia bacterium]|nr:radical SAM protein [Clostridia bacterium]